MSSRSWAWRKLGGSLFALAVFSGAAHAATASYGVTVTTPTTKFTAGTSNVFAVAVNIVTDGTIEFVDNIRITFPAGVTITSATGPSPFNFCGGGQGNFTNPNPTTVQWSTPSSPSGCGAFATGTFNFTVTADVDSGFTAEIMPVIVTTEGDGFGPGAPGLTVTTAQFARLSVASAIPTMDGVGLGVLALLLAGGSFAALRRRSE